MHGNLSKDLDDCRWSSWYLSVERGIVVFMALIEQELAREC